LQLVKKFPAFMETKSSSPYPQVPATYPYPEPTPSSTHDPLQLPEDPRILSHTRANSLGVLQVLLLLPCYHSRYVFREEEFYAPQNCHHFSSKRFRQAAHSNTPPMIVPWSINTCTKRLLIPDPSVSKCQR